MNGTRVNHRTFDQYLRKQTETGGNVQPIAAIPQNWLYSNEKNKNWYHASYQGNISGISQSILNTINQESNTER